MAVPCNIRGSASQLFYQDHQSPQYQAVLAITELPHPDRSVLGAFLVDARDPQEAARYFLRETVVDGTSQSVPTRTIWEFLSDWKYLISMWLSAETERMVYERDGGRCCLTQIQFKSPEDPDLRLVHIVPPRVLMNPDLVEGVSMFILYNTLFADTGTQKGRLSEMLYAFLSKGSVESLRTMLSLNPQPIERLDDLWLSSVSAFELVQTGEVSLKIRSWDQQNSPHRQSVGHHQTIRTSAH
ncbi:hypothetical protein N7465_005489 [Penicillium sp. CMV-2018d]|nr:hypothetical protein N7465_005489 [Penicillium sp. CMV-2018d]